ncbi:MAG: GGDEF domain-containing protein [Turneriella sp.]
MIWSTYFPDSGNINLYAGGARLIEAADGAGMSEIKFAIFSFALSLLLNLVSNVVVWRTTQISATRVWALSNLLTLIGLLCLFLFHKTGAHFLLWLQNLLYYASIAMVPAGLYQYRGRQFPLRANLLFISLAMAVVAAGIWWHNSFTIRTIVAASVLGAYSFYIVALILRQTRGKGPILLFAVSTWGAYGLVNLVRLVMTLIGAGIDDNKPFEGLAYFLVFLFGPFCTTGGYFGLILLIVQRLVDEKESSLAAAEKLAARYRDLSDHDPLTHALNGRSFMKNTEASLSDATKKSLPFSILMMDLDHFKRVNDNYGHAVGDTTLKNAVRTWQNLLRPGDLLGRVGGEEFAVALPNADAIGAARIAERLRQGLEATRMDFPETITASIGVAEAAPGESCEQALGRADSAMYAAKRAGRNRVTSG